MPLSSWSGFERRQLIGVFTDIDDTLTSQGAIAPEDVQHVLAVLQRGADFAQVAQAILQART